MHAGSVQEVLNYENEKTEISLQKHSFWMKVTITGLKISKWVNEGRQGEVVLVFQQTNWKKKKKPCTLEQKSAILHQKLISNSCTSSFQNSLEQSLSTQSSASDEAGFPINISYHVFSYDHLVYGTL